HKTVIQNTAPDFKSGAYPVRESLRHPPDHGPSPFFENRVPDPGIGDISPIHQNVIHGPGTLPASETIDPKLSRIPARCQYRPGWNRNRGMAGGKRSSLAFRDQRREEGKTFPIPTKKWPGKGIQA